MADRSRCRLVRVNQVTGTHRPADRNVLFLSYRSETTDNYTDVTDDLDRIPRGGDKYQAGRREMSEGGGQVKALIPGGEKKRVVCRANFYANLLMEGNNARKITQGTRNSPG